MFSHTKYDPVLVDYLYADVSDFDVQPYFQPIFIVLEFLWLLESAEVHK